LRYFWNEKCVTGLFDSSMNRVSRGDLAREFLHSRNARIDWYGWIGDERLENVDEIIHFGLVGLTLLNQI